MPGYVTILRRHIALVLLLGLAGLLAGTAAVLTRQPTYEAIADVRLEQVESPFRGPGGTRGDLTRAMQTQIDIATGDAVQARVRSELGFVPSIEVTVKGERDELTFRAVAETGEQAADAANAWAEGYAAVLRADAEADAERYLQAFDAAYNRVYDQIASLDARRATASGEALAQLDLQREVLVTQLRALAGRRTPEGTASAAQILASPVRAATAPEQPMSDTAKRLIALGLAGGLVVGYLLACLKEARRDEVRSAEDVGVAAPGTPVLGPLAIPGAGALTALEEPGTAADFQMLRAEVVALADAEPSSAVAVTSASGETAVAEVAAGLALSLARTGRRVVIIDAQLHHPRQHLLFSTVDRPGLTNVITDELPLEAALVPVPLKGGARLWLLPGGTARRDDLLATPSFAALVRALLADPEFDTVVIATPQLLGTADALAVAELASSVLVVAAPRRTRRRDLGAALNRLALAAPPMTAVVLASSKAEMDRRRARPGRRRRLEPEIQPPALHRAEAGREAPSRTDGEPVHTAGRPR